MNPQSGMKIREVFVLGSGESVSELTEAEIDYINRAECKLAINKFMAFHRVAGIMPTHVFFVDRHDNSLLFLQHIFDLCIRDRISNITFILDSRYRRRLATSTLSHLLKRLAFGVVLGLLPRWDRRVFRVPTDCQFQFISRPLSLEGGEWATSLEEPLFHYRGSLSTVLNYVSILFPDRVVKLVGCDFNSSDYFFQQQLEEVGLSWEDWTTPIVKEVDRHFSAIPYKGTTIFDRFDFIVNQMGRTGNRVYNCNPDSLLVKKGFMDYTSVITPERKQDGRPDS